MPSKLILILPLCLVALSAQADRRDGQTARHYGATYYRAAHSAATAPWEGNPKNVQLLTKKWEELSQDEKKRVREAKERYKSLPEDRQERLREKWENMPKNERDKYKLERRNK